MEDYGHKKEWRKRKEINIEEHEYFGDSSVLAFCNTNAVLMIMKQIDILQV